MLLEKYSQPICTSSSSSTPGRETSTSMLLSKVVTYTCSIFIEIKIVAAVVETTLYIVNWGQPNRDHLVTTNLPDLPNRW